MEEAREAALLNIDIMEEEKKARTASFKEARKSEKNSVLNGGCSGESAMVSNSQSTDSFLQDTERVLPYNYMLINLKSPSFIRETHGSDN